MDYSNNMYASFIRNRPRIIPNTTALAAAWDDLTANQGGYGDAATQAYLSRAGSFDPTTAINTYARGAWDQASTGMRDELRKLKGSAVGSGRLNTGFFDEDQGEVYKNTVADFNNRIAQTAVTGAGMQLQNNAGLANFASDRTNMFADLLASRREQVENDARAAAAAKKKKKKRYWWSFRKSDWWSWWVLSRWSYWRCCRIQVWWRYRLWYSELVKHA